MTLRAQVVQFERAFLRPEECEPDHPDRQHPELWERVFREEMPGVLNRLLAGFERVRCRGSFNPPARMRQAHEQWCATANPFSGFIHECLVQTHDEGHTLTPPELFDTYTHWADEERIPAKHRVHNVANLTKWAKRAGLKTKRNPTGDTKSVLVGVRYTEVGRKLSRGVFR